MRQLSMRYEGGRIIAPDRSDFIVRTYKDADFEGMLDALIPLTDKRYDAQELDKVILKRSGVRPEGVFVAEENGRIIGTATGYTHEADGDRPADNGGTLHMVSALKDVAGRGVGLSVCVAAVNYLIAAGCDYVDLTTDDFRKSAIVVYARLGFRPVIDDVDMENRWQRIAEETGLVVLTQEAYRI